METLLIKILSFLRGKKGSIASIIGLIVAYLATQAILGESEVILIMGVTTVLFGAASYGTARLYN